MPKTNKAIKVTQKIILLLLISSNLPQFIKQ